MFLAIFAYLISVVVIVAAARSFYRAERITGLAICCVIGLLTAFRPLILFAGFDVPSPEAWFRPTEYDLMAQASAMVCVWIGTIYAVYWLVEDAMPTRGFFPAAPRHAVFGHVLAVVLLLTALNVGITGWLISEMGGVAKFVYAVKIGKELTGFYVLREIGTLTVIIAIFLLLSLGRRSRDLPEDRRRTRFWLYITIAAMLINFTVNFTWGNRFNIATLSLAAVIGWNFYVRKFTPLTIAVTMAVAGSVLVSLRLLRNDLRSAAVDFEVSTNFAAWREISNSLHFVQYDGLMLALRDAGSRFDFTYGSEFLNGLVAWVPRFIMPDRESFMLGGWFRRVYEPDRINGWPITVIGDWYVNFSWLGILLGAALSGLLAALADKHYRNIRHSAWAAAIGSSLSFCLFEGGYGFGFVQRVVMLLLPLFLIARALDFSGRYLAGQPRTQGGSFAAR